jgi:hypothetical protein
VVGWGDKEKTWGEDKAGRATAIPLSTPRARSHSELNKMLKRDRGVLETAPGGTRPPTD